MPGHIQYVCRIRRRHVEHIQEICKHAQILGLTKLGLAPRPWDHPQASRPPPLALGSPHQDQPPGLRSTASPGSQPFAHCAHPTAKLATMSAVLGCKPCWSMMACRHLKWNMTTRRIKLPKHLCADSQSTSTLTISSSTNPGTTCV